MAKHYLKKAQKEYNRLMNGEIPVARVSGHLADLCEYLANGKILDSAGKPDLAQLDPGKTMRQVESALQEAKEDANKRISIGCARRCLDQEKEQGKKSYEPEPAHVYEKYGIVPVFRRAGIDTSLFANDGRPAIRDLYGLVEQAEMAAEAEDKIKFARRGGRAK